MSGLDRYKRRHAIAPKVRRRPIPEHLRGAARRRAGRDEQNTELVATLIVCILLVGAVGFAVWKIQFPSDATRRERQSRKQESVLRGTAILLTQEAVRARLEFPNDASFSWGADVKHFPKQRRVRVNGTVKVLNTFGARHTMNYSCLVQYFDDSTDWTILDVQLQQ